MAAMFQPSVPVWSTFIAMLSGVEPPPVLTKSHGLAKIGGILLAVAGAVTMTLGKLSDADNPSEESWLVQGSSVGSQFLGCVCLLCQSASTAIYYVIQKKYIFNQPYSPWKNLPMAVTAWSYFFGAIFMALASLTYVNQPEKFTSFSKEAFYCLVYAIFITSAMCYLLLSWCNMQAPSTFVTASWPLQSLFCAILSFIFLHKSLQLLEFFGGGFIICGLASVLLSAGFRFSADDMLPNLFVYPVEAYMADNPVKCNLSEVNILAPSIHSFVEATARSEDQKFFLNGLAVYSNLTDACQPLEDVRKANIQTHKVALVSGLKNNDFSLCPLNNITVNAQNAGYSVLICFVDELNERHQKKDDELPKDKVLIPVLYAVYNHCKPVIARGYWGRFDIKSFLTRNDRTNVDLSECHPTVYTPLNWRKCNHT